MILMKKSLLSLAALALAATVKAQVWIGGEVGFTTNHTNGSNHTAMELNIAPDIGYTLSDNCSLRYQLRCLLLLLSGSDTSILDKRLADIRNRQNLSDKILPYRPLLSFHSHPAATTLGIFRLII